MSTDSIYPARSYPARPYLARLSGLFLIALVFLFDQWSKLAVTNAAAQGLLPMEMLPVFSLILVHNHGISFGFLSGGQAWLPPIITLMTSLIALSLAVWLSRAREWPVCLALGLVIGGALGNISDRVRLGSVTDFLDAHWQNHHWPAFNIADSAIFMGVVILVLMSIVKPANQEEP